MARPRTPTALLELKGAFSKDPQRARPDEPEHNGPVGPPPPGFDGDLALIWHELVDMVPARVLAKSDRWTVELACRMMLQLRKDDFKAAELGILQSCLSRMGLTPADRSRIAVSPKEIEVDELAALAAEARAGNRPVN